MKLIRTLLIGAMALAALPAMAEQKFVTVLTGGTSGVYYPMGVAMSQLFGAALPNAKVSVQSTKASAENVNLLQAGRGEVAFALGDTVSYAWNGNEEVGFKSKLGKLRALAVSTAKRNSMMPEVPTMKEGGLPEIENLAWMALMTPSGTPDAIVQRMNQEINTILQMPDVKEKLNSYFMEPIGGSPQDLAAFMQTELRVMTPVIKRTGVKVD